MAVEQRTAAGYTGIVLGGVLIFLSDITVPVTLLLTLFIVTGAVWAARYDFFRNLVLAAGVLAFLHAAFQFFDIALLAVPASLEPVTFANLLTLVTETGALFSDAVALPLEAVGGFLAGAGAAVLRPDDAEPRIAYASLPLIFATLLVAGTGNVVFGVSMFVLTVFLQQGAVFRYGLYAFTVVGLVLNSVELYSIVTDQALFLPVFIENIGFYLPRLPATIAAVTGYVLVPVGVYLYNKRWRSKEELEAEVLHEQEEAEAVVWEEETTWDKAKRYFRQNPSAAKLMMVSVLLGILIASVANFYYFSIQTIHVQAFAQNNEEEMRAVSNQPFTTEFVADNPGELQEIEVTVRFRDIDQDTVLDARFNGESIGQVENSFPGDTKTYRFTPEQFQRVNTLTLSFNEDATVQGGGSRGAVTTIQKVEAKGTTGAQDIAFYVLNFLGMLGFLLPLLYLRYSTYQEKKELENRFPDFLRDVVSGTRAGMSLTQAIKNVEEHDYGKMTPYVQKMAAQIDWGISFEKIMERFADDTKSRIIQRAVSTINQSYRSGGNIYKVLEAVSDNIEEVKKLERERTSELYGSMISGYIIYGVFLVVLVVMARYLIPNLVFEFSLPGGSGGGITDPQPLFSIFRGLIIIQAIFSGLVIGKLGEGDIKAGAKHVGILLILGYAVAVIFI
jgi:flagellar protein FlaJ